jgi:hypothetical protein
LDSKLDHIVIGAAELGAATSIIETQMGVEFGVGGVHPLMATHNRLLRMGDGSYLEIIAADPAATPPRPRWFSLDVPSTKARLAKGPCPLCWVVAVPDLDVAVNDCGYDAGSIIEMSRGDLNWRLTVADDGLLAGDGVLPVLIEWPGGRNPTNRMPESPVRLTGLALTHPEPNWIADVLVRLGVSEVVKLSEGAPGLAFKFETPRGFLVLDSVAP